jgi:hypothetical protein
MTDASHTMGMAPRKAFTAFWASKLRGTIVEDTASPLRAGRASGYMQAQPTMERPGATPGPGALSALAGRPDELRIFLKSLSGATAHEGTVSPLRSQSAGRTRMEILVAAGVMFATAAIVFWGILAAAGRY